MRGTVLDGRFVSLQAMPYAKAMFDDRGDLLLRRLDGLLLFYRWRVGALMGYIMP